MSGTRNATSVIWLIDAAYVLKGHQGNIDYIDLRRKLQEWAIERWQGRFDRIIFYNSTSNAPGVNNSDNFLDMLTRNGFETKLFPLKRMNVKCESCEYQGQRIVQKGVDVAICTDLLSLAYEGKFRRVVLTAGDGDFLEAVKKVQSIFREVYIAGYKNSMSKDLIAQADKLYWIQ